MEEQQFKIAYASNKSFIVCVKDILAAPVDAIVNPANSHLAHGGGLAAIIAREAGMELENECSKIINEQGQVPVGEAVLTNAGRLPFKGIIHAVGPRMGTGEELKKINSAIVSVLDLANQKQWRSVAFPAISTGIFNVPISICAQAFKQAVPHYFEKNPDTSIETIRLCLMTQDFDEFKKYIETGS